MGYGTLRTSRDETNAKSEYFMDKLEVEVDKITYQNSANGWAVVRATDLKSMDSVTITGYLSNSSPGQQYQVAGIWELHPTFGRQFRAEKAEPRMPVSRAGAIKFLSSGRFPGIGVKTAERIVTYLGENPLKTLELNPAKLHSVPKISKKIATEFQRQWETQKEHAATYASLGSLGIGPKLASLIVARYKSNAHKIVLTNPYQLIEDFYGVGFTTADLIASKNGMAPNDVRRVRAAVQTVLKASELEGNCFIYLRDFFDQASRLLSIPLGPEMTGVLSQLALEKKIGLEPRSKPERIFATDLYEAEMEVIEFLKLNANLTVSTQEFTQEDFEAIGCGFATDEQKSAINRCLRNKVSILTGGPGVGKTTITNIILKLWQRQKKTVTLAAPTGRAAQRLSEVSNQPAKTIHRLLEFLPAENCFKRNSEYPLAENNLLIVDESSMLDIRLVRALINALHPECQVIFVGDQDQLPPVGPGNFFKDSVQGRLLATTELKTMHRQAKNSQIKRTAHLINQGTFQPLSREYNTDLWFIDAKNANEVSEVLKKLMTKILPDRGYNPISECQIISPVNKGDLGCRTLNAQLQHALNPAVLEVSASDRPKIHPDDKVIQTTNNYDLMIFNGDVGRVVEIKSDKSVTVQFGQKTVSYTPQIVTQLSLAYAITIHKSQGSEFPVVIIPMTFAHRIMLQRNLIYTALTRGKKLAIIVGSEQALRFAVENDYARTRNTFMGSTEVTSTDAFLAPML